jgi:hypothetical protein
MPVGSSAQRARLAGSRTCALMPATQRNARSSGETPEYDRALACGVRAQECREPQREPHFQKPRMGRPCPPVARQAAAVC